MFRKLLGITVNLFLIVAIIGGIVEGSSGEYSSQGWVGTILSLLLLGIPIVLLNIVIWVPKSEKWSVTYWLRKCQLMDGQDQSGVIPQPNENQSLQDFYIQKSLELQAQQNLMVRRIMFGVAALVITLVLIPSLQSCN